MRRLLIALGSLAPLLLTAPPAEAQPPVKIGLIMPYSGQFADTGIPTTTSYLYNTTAVGVAGVPASLQLPQGSQNTPRSLITNFDTTKRGFMQIDYNHTFNAGGTHQLKGGYGYQHTLNDVDSAYPRRHRQESLSQISLRRRKGSVQGGS